MHKHRIETTVFLFFKYFHNNFIIIKSNTIKINGKT